jgi:glutathione S-transferase
MRPDEVLAEHEAAGRELPVQVVIREQAAQTAALERLVAERAGQRLVGEGPYWFGRDVSLVDLAFYPWFERLGAVSRLREYRLPAHARLARWIDAVASRPSVTEVANSVDFYVQRFAASLRPPNGMAESAPRARA